MTNPREQGLVNIYYQGHVVNWIGVGSLMIEVCTGFGVVGRILPMETFDAMEELWAIRQGHEHGRRQLQ